MTHERTFRATLTQLLPRHTWISIADIYAMVEKSMPLDADDWRCPGRGTRIPSWHKNVRKVLYALRREGRLLSRSSP